MEKYGRRDMERENILKKKQSLMRCMQMRGTQKSVDGGKYGWMIE